MQKLVLLLAGQLIMLYGFGQTTDPALQAHIKRLELAHAQAIFQADAAALDSLMDDSITVNHPTNRIVHEKSELLQLIQQGIIRYTAFERTPEKFLFFDNDMAVVMGSEVVVPAKGAPHAGESIRRRYTNVWMKQSGKWKLTIRHANLVCEDF